MRSEQIFPFKGFDTDLCTFLYKAWNDGWLDEYSDDHFLIKAIEQRLETFVGMDQMISNNINLQGIVNADGSIDQERFCWNFCVNFSFKMQSLESVFGEENIKRFMMDQMSAGKKKYDEDTFFEALSEVSVLCFLAGINEWETAEYEPKKDLNNDKNPEASFSGVIYGRKNKNEKEPTTHKVKVNVEVKAPRFPHDTHEKEKIVIPIALLTQEGRKQVKEFCAQNDIRYLDPRIMKIKDFINSAAGKFSIPEEDEYNILFINWSYRDFPANGYYEAWALLSNDINGIVNHPDIAQSLGIAPDAFEKITAIVAYTESLEGLMFGDFRYIWQRNNQNQPRFCMCVLDKEKKRKEWNDESDLLFKITYMNPSYDWNMRLLIDTKSKSQEELIKNSELVDNLLQIVEANLLT